MKTYNDMTRQAIFTKYISLTNTKGSKVKAYCERGSITLCVDSELSMEMNHVAATVALLAKFANEDGSDKSWGFIGSYACGASPRHEKSSYVFVDVGNR
jgi:hypothetical protein